MRRLAAPLLLALVLASSVSWNAGPSTVARAAPVDFAIIACENLAPYLDGDPADTTTPDDESAACASSIPPTGPLSFASLAGAVGDSAMPLAPTELAPLDLLDHNRLPPDCTYDAVVVQQTVSTVGCVLVAVGFFDDNVPVRFSASSSLRLVESGTTEYICEIEDADCDGDGLTIGDGIVAVRILNYSAGEGDTAYASAVQENILYPGVLHVSTSTRFDLNAANDVDGDGQNDPVDNCPDDFNPLQLNSDTDPVFVAAGLPLDVTAPNGDSFGDACDDDDDNDGLSDDIEVRIPSPDISGCDAVTGPTDALVLDTDGDRVLDGAECALESDPVNPNSLPPPLATDTDGDGLDDVFENGQDFSSIDPDTDDDRIADGIEFLHYGTSPLQPDTDFDGCPDGVEIASVDGNTTVNIVDVMIVVYGASLAPPPPLLDLNGDSAINVLDLLLIAANFSGTPCAPPTD